MYSAAKQLSTRLRRVGVTIGFLMLPAASSALAAPLMLSHPRESGYVVDNRRPLLTADGDALFLSHTPDGSRDLFQVSLSGGPIRSLSESVTGSRYDVGDVHVNMKSTHVVFRSTASSTTGDLWSVPLAGGPAIRLTDQDDVGTFGFGPITQLNSDGTEVYFGETSLSSNARYGLFAAPVDGSSSPRPIVPGRFPQYWTGPVVDEVRGAVIFGSSIDDAGRQDLYVADPAGSQRKRVNAVDGQSSSFSMPFEYSRSTGRVIYATDNDGRGPGGLYSVHIDGSDHVTLDTALSRDQIFSKEFWASPDGKTVVFVSNRNGSGKREVFAVDVAGGSVTDVSGPLNAQFAPTTDLVFSPDGDRVAFATRDDELPFRFNLYVSSLRDGTTADLGPVRGSTSSFPSLFLRFSEDGEVLARSKSGGADFFDVATGDALGTLGRLSGYEFLPNGRGIIYAAASAESEAFQIYWADLYDLENPIQLSNIESVRNEIAFTLTDDGMSVVYASERDGLFVVDLPPQAIPEPATILALALSVLVCASRLRPPRTAVLR